jgi:K+-transporting ATPase ATPase C chain
VRELRSALAALLAATAVLGVAYPLLMTGAAGIVPDSPPPVGQDFSKQPNRFQGRPSVTGYAAATFFNNQGPNQRALADQLRGFVRLYLHREGPYTPGLSAARIPADAVTTSASGIDPDISRANARIQANRVAARTGLSRARVLALVDAHRRHGDAVDVVALNAALTEATR